MANEFIARNGVIAQNNSIVTGSLTVTQGISGSFSGSGANLFNIPASGITGLNLSQISSGSVSASISPSNGLQVNTYISASAYYGDGSNLTTKIRRHDYVTVFASDSLDYNGKAPFGSSENANVWTITRLTINAYGTTTVASASNASWTNRESATYS